MQLRVLTWNLMHGRAVPPAGRDLFAEFAATLAGWDWDVALLQETPPWWPARLAVESRAEHRKVITSRNALLPLRRAIATRWPDAIKSNGGGCNAILVRRGRITDHRVRRLCRLPERRWLHAVGVVAEPGDSPAGAAKEGGAGAERVLWVGNLHATVRDDAAARREAHLAARTMLAWAQGAPSALGGDFNVRSLALEGFSHAGGFDVDHVFVSGVRRGGDGVQVLERGRLSDHAPVLVSVIDLGA